MKKPETINVLLTLIPDTHSWDLYTKSFKGSIRHFGIPTQYPCLVTSFTSEASDTTTTALYVEHRFCYCSDALQLQDMRRKLNTRLRFLD